MKTARLLVVLFALLSVALSFATDPKAVVGEPAGPPLEGAALEAKADSVASGIRCPVCQGLSVNASPNPTAEAMNKEVWDLIAAGYSRDQVFTYFERSYGEFIRLEPKAEGFNLTVWFAPFVILAVGLGLIAVRLRGVRARKADHVGDSGSEADSSTQQTEEDLSAYLEQLRQEIDE